MVKPIEHWRCSGCGEPLDRPERDGGLLIVGSRAVRVPPTGGVAVVIVPCSGCGARARWSGKPPGYEIKEEGDMGRSRVEHKASAPALERKVVRPGAIQVKATTSGWEVSGYASTFDDAEPDSYGDVIAPGAFSKSIAARRTKLCLEHGQVIGTELELKEDRRGLYGRWSIVDTAAGTDAYKLLKAGAVDRMSIGYLPLKSTKRADGARILTEIELWEVSLVGFPANQNAEVTNVKNQRGAATVINFDDMRAVVERAGVSTIGGSNGSLGERVTKSREYRAGQPFATTVTIELKALLTSTLPSVDVRDDQIVMPRPPTLLDAIPIVPTTNGLVRVLRPTLTNNAAPVAEATATTGTSGLKPESDLAIGYDERPTEQIAHWVTATERILDDAASLRTVIDGELRSGVLDVLAAQVAAGNGTRPNLLGIAATPGVGSITSTGDGIGSLVAAIGQVVTVGRRQPTVIAMAADAWAKLIATAALGSVGLLGRPAILGIPVIPVFGMPTGTAIVGDAATAAVFEQGALEVTVGHQGSQFTRNQVTIRAELLAGCGVSRPTAWVKISGLPV